MVRKFFIAAAGAAFFIAAGASAASAEVNEVNIGINLYSGGGYPTYYPQPTPVYPAYPAAYDSNDGYDNSDCGYEYTTVRKWNRYHTGYRIVHRRVWVCN